jgi:lipopolysaccharide biosynthesis regulator YciM
MFDLSFYYVVGVAVILLMAVALFAALVRRGGRRLDDRELYIQALRDLLDGDDTAAFYKLKQVVTQNSENIDAYLRLGRILRSHGDPQSAIQVHSELLLRTRLKPEQVKAIRVDLIDDYIAAGQSPKAITMLEKEFEQDPRDRNLGEKLLRQLKEQEAWERAEKVAERLYKQDNEAYKSELADIRIKLADSLQSDEHGKKARIFYKSAFNVDDSRALAYVKVGDSYLNENRVDDAVKAWRHLALTQPSQAHLVLSRLEAALYDLGQFNALAGILEQVLEADPQNLEIALAMANLHLKKGDYDRASELYRQVLELNRDHPTALLGLARIYREQGRNDEALDILEKLHSGEEPARPEA